MPKKLITPPTAQPVTLVEAKAHLRRPSADDDTYIESKIPVGTEHVENYCERALMPQTWDAYFDEFPVRRHRGIMENIRPFGSHEYPGREQEYLELPLPPLQSVTSVKYIDPAGAEQTLDPTVYYVDAVSEPARLYLAPGQTWPAVIQRKNAVVVRCVCGYADAAAVPATLKLAIELVVANFYENRELVSLVAGAQPYEMPMGVKDLLTPYKANSI